MILDGWRKGQRHVNKPIPPGRKLFLTSYTSLDNGFSCPHCLLFFTTLGLNVHFLMTHLLLSDSKYFRTDIKARWSEEYFKIMNLSRVRWEWTHRQMLHSSRGHMNRLKSVNNKHLMNTQWTVFCTTTSKWKSQRTISSFHLLKDVLLLIFNSFFLISFLPCTCTYEVSRVIEGQVLYSLDFSWCHYCIIEDRFLKLNL